MEIRGVRFLLSEKELEREKKRENKIKLLDGLIETFKRSRSQRCLVTPRIFRLISHVYFYIFLIRSNRNLSEIFKKGCKKCQNVMYHLCPERLVVL